MLIDPTIRDWVLFPLLALVIVVHYLRSSVMRLFASPPAPNVKEAAQKYLVARSARLRAAGGAITARGFAMRKDFLAGGEGAVLLDESVADKNPAANPMASMDMMKGQLMNMVLGMGPLMWVNYALTGFLLVKLPFPLAARFKSMTQQGIVLPELDPSYVSSMSFFFIAQSAIPRILMLFNRRAASPEMAEQEAKMSQIAMGMPPAMMGAAAAPGGPGGFLAKTAFKAEVSALSTAEFSSSLTAGEAVLIGEGRAALARAMAAARTRAKAAVAPSISTSVAPSAGSAVAAGVISSASAAAGGAAAGRGVRSASFSAAAASTAEE